MTNQPGNRGNRGARCAYCGKPLRGYREWLCKEHRTDEFAAIANARIIAKQAEAKT